MEVTFLAWFLVPQLSAIVFSVIAFLYRKLRKRELKPGPLLARAISSAAFSFLTGLAIAVLQFLLFERLGFWPSFGTQFFLFSIVYFLNPASISAFPRSLRPSKAKFILTGVLGTFFLLEVFVFNFKAYQVGGGSVYIGEDPELISIVDAPEGDSEETDALLTLKDDESFVIYKGDREYLDIYVEMAPTDPGAYLSVSLEFSEDGMVFAGKTAYETSSWSHNSMVYSIPLEYRADPYVRFCVNFEGWRVEDPSYVEVTDVGFDVPLAFDFSYLRMGAITLFAVVIASLDRLGRNYAEDKKKATWIPYAVIGGFTAVALAAFFVYASFDVGRYFTPYPMNQATLDSMEETNIYERLFDAFHKGLVYLDVYVDPGLAEVDNPWSSAVWNEYGLEFRWDHAYFEGKYYCYYGPAPVILVMFPVYYLSGCTLIPSLITLQAVGMILCLGAMAFLVYEIGRLIMGERIHYPLLAFLFVIAVFTSVYPNMMTFKEGYYHEGVYHAPIIYGQAFADLFLAFAIMAYRDKKHSFVTLPLAGIAIVGVAASRPNLAVYAILSLPFLIGLLVAKDVPAKKKLIAFGPAGAIVALGAFGLCYYNYIRFGDILEFGQTWQMNYDQRFLTYSANKIFPSIIHFFFQPPAIYGEFPFLSCSVIRLPIDDGLYFQGYLGILLVPFFYFMASGPFIGRKKSPLVTRFFVGLFLPVAFLWAFTTYSKAGICARYLAELYHLATMGSIASFLLLMEQSDSPETRKGLSAVMAVAAFVSAFIGIALCFDSFDGWLPGDLFGLPEAIKEAWWVYNV